MGELSDVSAATVFDVLNDPAYRRKWDLSMHEGFEICQFSANSDIGYYARMFPIISTNHSTVIMLVY